MVKNNEKPFGFSELQGSYGTLISPYYRNGKVVPNKVVSKTAEDLGREI